MTMPCAAAAASPISRPVDTRTRRLLEAPLLRTLLALAVPNTLVMVTQVGISLLEVYFIAKLGLDALAGASQVFPLVALIVALSQGAVGGGIVAAIARALGGGHHGEANRLVWHAVAIAVAIAVVFGIATTLVTLLLGPWIYAAMGTQGAALEAALRYSTVTFGGAVLIWLFNTLIAVLRGTGNVTLSMAVVCGGALLLVPLSPLLIFGLGPLPGLGITGGALAPLIYYALGSLCFAGYIWGLRGVLRPAMRPPRLKWQPIWRILRVGRPSSLVSASTNVTLALVTGFVGAHGAAAMTEAVGLAAACWPELWLGNFSTDAAALATGTTYLRITGPFFGCFGAAFALYCCAQGTGRMGWPLTGALMRSAIAIMAGIATAGMTNGLEYLFVGVGMTAFCLLSLPSLIRRLGYDDQTLS